jgi:hypothetical protein
VLVRDIRSAVVGGVLVILGVALGAIVFRSEPADAQAGPYRECVFGRQETHDINGEGRWELADREFQGNRIIRIPRGWDVVGSGGLGVTGVVMICRR